MGEKIYDIRLGNDFLDITATVQVTEQKIDKFVFIELKTFVHQRTLST